ncbi:secretin and TonB N-terminal domain-containing protein [Bacteroidota bacterium]
MKKRQENHKRLRKKSLNELNKTIIILLVLVCISFKTFSEDKKITISIKDATIEEVLKEIQKQTGINYLFNHEEIPVVNTVTVDVINGSVEDVLKQCLKNTNLTYKIQNNVIIITPKNEIQTEELFTQVIRGKVIDAESQTALPFANIAIITTDPLLGAVTDEEGNFRVEEVPIGRHYIKVSYVGYENQIIPELMVSTGKEMVLTIKMKELISELKEVSIKAYTKKDKALNSMSTVSARTFSVEEGRRYAGGFDDPGRLVSSFAGITTETTRDNTIIIRGNSPKGLLWRLEGVEIPNPNHFANLQTFGGGGISTLSALVVGNSDFFTGAFPAEYGNATSGVFDIKLRNGNNEKHEHAFQLGTMGIDISSEGPIVKKSRASYLFNYRYSTMDLVKEFFPEDLKNFIPVYQDLCFKINLPTKKSGIFSVWGLASNNKSSFPAKEDTSQWKITMDRFDNTVTQSKGGLGFNHRYIFQKHSWLNTSLAVTGDYMKYEDDILDFDLNRYDYNNINVSNYKYTLTSVYNHKFSAKHSFRTGFIVNNMHYDIDLQYAPVYNLGLISIADENDASNIVQGFLQSKIIITKRFLINPGFHAHYFNLNSEFVVEPRLGLIYNLDKAQSVSLAYGKHSRIEPLTLYFAKINDGTNITQPNKDLKVSKAHHFVFAYDKSLNPHLRLKIEPYYQYLYDVPVIPDSNYSVLNLEMEWYSFNKELVNTGTGKNMGIDITLERFLKNGYYYLFTASFFDSKYKGDDGIERNTRFNTQYVINLLYGKEWIVGEQNNKILGVNAKVNFFGGKRKTPVNAEQSILAEDVVYYNSQLFDDKEQSKFHVNATINYRINKKKHSSIWSLQMMNLFLVSENYGYFYNYKTKQVEPWEMAVPNPSLSYKIEF